MVDLAKMKSLGSWPVTRGAIEASVLEVLGKLPPERAELQVKTVDEHDFPGYVRKRVNYFVSSWERISAWLFVPDGKEEMPAILCCHQETRQGKEEPAGIDGDPRLAFAQHYAELGYVTIAPDCITAGERCAPRQEAYDTKAYYKDHAKLSAAGKMLLDHLHALDLLEEQKRVDAARIGVVGHGLGGFNALLLTAFDERVRACVASCGFTRFATDSEPERWTPEQGLVLLPKLREHIAAKKFPFDWEHILALAAPSPTLVITSMKNTPYAEPKSCEKAVQTAARIYKLLGAQDALEHFSHNAGYAMTSDLVDLADDWFERWL